MQERHSVRYDTQILPKSLRTVTVTWGSDTAVEADVANFCTHGMKVIIPPVPPPADIPKKHDTIKVKLPVFPVWVTGKCTYVAVEEDGSVSLGICYFVPIEQNVLNEFLSKTMEGPLQTCSTVCHQWRELVGKRYTPAPPQLP
ncbi:MAG: hypothetical protein M0T70_16310 [Geobacteraceae bacterium]|nr:hypothetical protein [Geobacteraceae bacterium]